MIKEIIALLVISNFLILSLQSQDSQREVVIYDEVVKSKKQDIDFESSFKLNKSVLQNIFLTKSSNLKVALPFRERKVVLDLQERGFYSDDIKLKLLPSNEEINLPLSKYYKGEVHGYKNSLVAIQITPDGVSGIISFNHETYDLGLTDEKSNIHSIYRNSNYTDDLVFNCGVHEMENSIMRTSSREKSSTANFCKPVEVYLECDHYMFNQFGSVASTNNFVTNLFNVVSILFANEGINISISEINIWTEPAPYTESSGEEALDEFTDALDGNFNGQLAHLLSGSPANNGGWAFINVICSNSKSNSTAYSNINMFYNELPTYSWDVNLIAHELGHNFGSRHTHDCVWGINSNEPIDCCGQQTGDSGVSCEDCMAQIPNYGTIMSYCNNVTQVDLSLGFGVEPGQLIASNYDNCNCGTCDDGDLNVYETGVDCGGLHCPICPCEESEYVLDVIPSKDIDVLVTDSIIASSNILFDQRTKLHAEKSVKFLPGFHAVGGSTVSAAIEDCDTILDNDGNIYPIVYLDGMLWMSENLKTTTLSDNAPMENGLSSWLGVSQPLYAWYNDNLSQKEIYGGLYNYYAVESGKICPEGWHVSTEKDWRNIQASNKGTLSSNLKVTGNDFWITGNGGATNSTELSVLPGGIRNPSANSFYSKGYVAHFWTSNETNPLDTGYFVLGSNSYMGYQSGDLKSSGKSIRCVRD